MYHIFRIFQNLVWLSYRNSLLYTAILFFAIENKDNSEQIFASKVYSRAKPLCSTVTCYQTPFYDKLLCFWHPSIISDHFTSNREVYGSIGPRSQLVRDTLHMGYDSQQQLEKQTNKQISKSYKIFKNTGGTDLTLSHVRVTVLDIFIISNAIVGVIPKDPANSAS